MLHNMFNCILINADFSCSLVKKISSKLQLFTGCNCSFGTFEFNFSRWCIQQHQW